MKQWISSFREQTADSFIVKIMLPCSISSTCILMSLIRCFSVFLFVWKVTAAGLCCRLYIQFHYLIKGAFHISCWVCLKMCSACALYQCSTTAGFMECIFLLAHSSPVNFAELVLVIFVVFAHAVKIRIISHSSRRYGNYVSGVWKCVRLIFWKTTACLLSMKLLWQGKSSTTPRLTNHLHFRRRH